jgi:hypothetical protein
MGKNAPSEPLHGTQQLHSDPTKAHWALVHLMAAATKENDRYFTLSDDGVLTECDQDTWSKEWANREKTRVKIACSPGIDAEICFSGWSVAINDMDGEVRLWTAGFYDKATNVHHGGPPFKTFEGAKAFVDRFVALGCPAFGSLQWMQFRAEFQAG